VYINVHKGRAQGQFEGLRGRASESPVELGSASLVLGLLMVLMCSWGAWHTAVQPPSSSVDRTLSAQRLPLGQQLHGFRNKCIAAGLPQPLLACTEDTRGTIVDITMWVR